MSAKHNDQLPSAIPLPLEIEVLKELVPKAKDWALMHGATIRSVANFSKDAVTFTPFVLTPSACPRKEFQRALDLQPVVNRLVHAVAHNREFLVNCLKETIKVDDFTKRLFDIYDAVYEEGFAQPISLGLLRSDLMLETNCMAPHTDASDARRPYCCWKQVEFNTIASGSVWMAGMSPRAIQRFVLEELGEHQKIADLPENNGLEGMCSGIVEAHRLYDVPHAVILFLVEDVTYNICDQRFYEFEIKRLNPKVKVKRRTLTEIAMAGRLGDRKELLIDDFEVAVVYFRAGYEPPQYPTDREWEARLLIERSLAIKCPSIQYHLAGTKKVQQELSAPGCLERFLSDPQEVQAMRAIFTGLYTLGLDETGANNVKMAMENPERYVLKPQREGGSNNVYGHEVREALARMGENERSAWILMERIKPPISKSYMIQPGGPEVPEMVDLVSELGIYGLIIGTSEKVLENKQVGHMVRTKVATANEGGIIHGLGVVDSPFLFD